MRQCCDAGVLEPRAAATGVAIGEGMKQPQPWYGSGLGARSARWSGAVDVLAGEDAGHPQLHTRVLVPNATFPIDSEAEDANRGERCMQA